MLKGGKKVIDKIKSVMLGHAIGDALGVPVEFCARESLEKRPVTKMVGFGTYNVPAGTWSDDTSMSLCALESLGKGVVKYDDIMENFCKWYYHNEFTATGIMFDVGNTCANAIENYFDLGRAPLKCGSISVNSNGNGSLMRIHPFVLYAYSKGIVGSDLIDVIRNASSLTHGHIISIDACIIYSCILTQLLKNPDKDSIYNGLYRAERSISYASKTCYARLFSEDFAITAKSEIKSSGYVVASLEAAIWCLLTTDNYTDCVLKAVNLGGDTDTIAAIAGGLAGALYGIDSIPAEWLKTLKNKNYIDDLCESAYKKWSEK